ncbi:hypothetical protein BD410DRAFT_843393 [Rickenella mellea]|uniref:Uncharacterized protein n=1 Tax=Rickenella mellea TaxID=50990 RepID=A0A4Y7PT42_9AGAM|nr:hypothetical protein BD410DRAFT_843393 [Rickenella mellea]
MPSSPEASNPDTSPTLSQDEKPARPSSSDTVNEKTDVAPSVTFGGYPEAPSTTMFSRPYPYPYPYPPSVPPSIKSKKSAETLPVTISSPAPGPYAPQIYPSVFRRTPHHYDDEDARKLHSMPNLSPHKNIDIHYDPAPLERPFRSPNMSVVSLPESFGRHGLTDQSPFHDSTRRKQLCDAVYGPGFTNPPIAIYAEWLDWQTNRNIERSNNYVHQIDLLGDFLEARKPGEEAKIEDFIEVMRASQGWPHWFGLDESLNAWYVVATTLLIPIYVPIKETCVTFEDQVRHMYPPMPPHLAPKKFNTTLSDILNCGLIVKPTDFFFEHFQIIEGETTVKIFFISGTSAHWSRLYDQNRAVKALGMDTLMKEIIASTFAIFEYNQFNKKAEELGLIVCNGAADYFSISSIFRDYQHVPPKLLAERAAAIEDLIKSRRSFRRSFRRDLRRQMKDQPFIFWGTVLAIFFGICTIIQTVASIWALVIAIEALKTGNPQAGPGNTVNGPSGNGTGSS